MKRNSARAFAVALILLVAGLAEWRAAGAQGMVDSRQIVFATPSLRCDGQPHYATPWTAPYPITVARAEGWIGTDGANAGTGGKFPPVDTYLSLHTSNSRWGAPFFLGLDHYVEFTGTHDKDKVFSAWDAPRLNTGEQLNIELYCGEITSLPSHVQANLIVSYVVGWP